MAERIKFGFAIGYNLVIAAFQPSGAGRGIEGQPLYERVPTGFYSAEPATELVDGDVVLAYELETVYWEDEIVVVLTAENVLYEGEQVYWEGAMVFDFDSVSTDRVTWTGNVVGSGEYTFGAGDASSLVTDVEDVLDAQQRVDTDIDDRNGNGAAGAGAGIGGGIMSGIITDC